MDGHEWIKMWMILLQGALSVKGWGNVCMYVFRMYLFLSVLSYRECRLVYLSGL